MVAMVGGIDTDSRDVLETHAMHSPEPDRVVRFRQEEIHWDERSRT